MAEYVEMTAEDMETFTAWCRSKGMNPPGATFSGSASLGSASTKADRIRAVELAVSSGPSQVTHRSNQILAFINGESITTLITPLIRLLSTCYDVFQAQDMADHVAVFDRVTDMRDAFGGVLAAMDELGIDRPKVEGAVGVDGEDGRNG